MTEDGLPREGFADTTERLADLLDGVGVEWERRGDLYLVHDREGRRCELMMPTMFRTTYIVYANDTTHGMLAAGERFDTHSLRNILGTLLTEAR